MTDATHVSSRRWSTVHDLASLRLHPDGSRVQPVTAKNLRPRNAPYTARDARGNWIAQDAGGSGTVKKTQRKRAIDDVDDNLDLDDSNGERDARGNSTKGKESERTGDYQESEGDDEQDDDDDDEFVDPRASKRQRFASDLGFLDIPVGSSSDAGQSSMMSIPQDPSSDLLKCIHYFASQYYTTRHQLFDSTRDARRERRIRHFRRLQKYHLPSTDTDVRSGPHINVGNADKENVEGGEGEDRYDVDDGEDEIDNDSSGESVSKDKSTSRGKRRHPRSKTLVRDMYKAMDGSALITIGMLIQEHVLSMLIAEKPEGWDDIEEIAQPENELEKDPKEEGEGERKNKVGGRKRRRKRRKETEIP